MYLLKIDKLVCGQRYASFCGIQIEKFWLVINIFFKCSS